MAKTPLSLTADPTVKGAPVGFTLPINHMSISVGAGFIIPFTGEVCIINIFFLVIERFIVLDNKNAWITNKTCNIRHRFEY